MGLFSKNGTNGHFKFPDILLEADLNTGPSDGNNKKYQRPAAQYDDPVWHLGWTDGRLGQPVEPHEEVLLSEAKVHWHEEIREARKQIAGARARINALKKRLEPVEKKLGYLHTYYSDLLIKRNRDSTGHSLPLGLIYSFFGLILFLADVPLSIKLVADGFGIPIERKIPELGDKLTGVGQVFQHPLLVLQYLWEPLFLALGIAFMGILVKFFVDAVILREDDEKEVAKRKTWGMWMFFALFVAATICLGLFRAKVQTRLNKTSLDYETATFIFLTLTFPIAGGLCFSAGWRRIERAKHYYLTLFRLWRLERKHNREFAEYSDALGAMNSLEYTLDSGSDQAAVSMAELRRNLYRHGYYRGRDVPETLDAADTLYVRCERALDRMLSRKIRKKLHQDP
jgi:hypothetical protein